MTDKANTLKDLELLIRSHYSIIFLQSPDENRAKTLTRHLADHLRLPFFIWTPTKGLKREDLNSKGPVYGSEQLSNALSHIESSKFEAIYLFEGLTDYFQQKLIISQIKDASNQFSKNRGAIIISGNDLEIPEKIKPLSTLFKIPEPERKEYRDLLNHIVRDLYQRMNIQVIIDEELTTLLLNNLKGLTLMEAEKILTKIIIEDRKLDRKDIRNIIKEKKIIVEREGVLEYYPVEENMAETADLNGLKIWLSKRKEIITNPEHAIEFGLEFPKGILLLGVPGCGKSLCAKATATEWGLPLLKLDPSNLYNKYIGESEKNFKRAIYTAEKMSPVILWIDEIEKAFASVGSNDDSGVSMRIFGTFLSWLQDRKGDVFIIATANDINRLPPEFLRKGRFDEIFFVDLPDEESREKIFDIHLLKRGKRVDKFDLDMLVDLTSGFTGAEIEQVVVSGLYTAFSQKKELTNEIIVSEISLTTSISTIMAEKIEYLRTWAKDKTVSAN